VRGGGVLQWQHEIRLGSEDALGYDGEQFGRRGIHVAEDLPGARPFDGCPVL
jgi:hypothetical protein